MTLCNWRLPLGIFRRLGDRWAVGWVGVVLLAPVAAGQVVLTEFSAANATGLADEEGSAEDWIEVANRGVVTVSLEGWYLTDDPDDRRKWTFPETNLAPDAYLVVFASGKDRRTAGAPLHTNFRLAADSDYLALVQPDGITLATEFAPAYPRQFRDVSFGFGVEQDTLVLVAERAAGRLRVPADGLLGWSWTAAAFDDAGWLAVVNGVGYDTGEVDPNEALFASRVLAAEPALYWRLDEVSGLRAANLGTLADTAEGQYVGDPDLGQAGPRPPGFPAFEPGNRALALDGADDHVTGPVGLLSDRAEFTLAGWIRPSVVQADRTGLWGQNDAVEFGFISGSTLQLWTPVGSVELGYPHPPGEWHHVAAVGNVQALQIYLDGVLAAESGGGGGNYGSSPYAFNAGGGGIFDPSGNAFAGQMDEVAVWSRALSAEEVGGLITGTALVDFGPYLATDLRNPLQGVNSSVYLRFPFVLADPTTVSRLILRVRYDDGFVAWLNGIPVAGVNAPEVPEWNSAATQRQADARAVAWEESELSGGPDALVAGANCLAIQGLNIDAANTDFLLQAELRAFRSGPWSTMPRYFTVPTPGAPNGSGTADLGPILVDAVHAPAEPADAEALRVEARVSEAFAPIAAVQLHYRVMFGAESAVPMNDAGAAGDTAAGDGIWTGVVPASAAGPGQMIRYYVTATDALGRGSRWPLHPDPLDSEAYLGTVVTDPSIQSALPVLHLFIENAAAADSTSGTRASLYYGGELYDNVLISVHGQSSRNFPKKSYNLDFTADHRFRYRPGERRVQDIRLMSNWGDKARVRNALAYEYVAAAGSLGHFAFQVRVHRNAQFFSIADMMEDGDDRWLERLGRNPDGALYKMYNNLGSAGGNEKKTRRGEGFSDLQAFIDNLDPARPLSQRAVYAWDRVDLPQAVSYFVALALCSSQDHGHKNFYVYGDHDGSGEWAILPWDVDLTWGRNWLDAQGYFTDTLFQDNVLDFYNLAQQNKPSNRLYQLIFQQPEFRAMLLRRLRTVMDEVLQPPGTPPAELRIERRVREMMEAMDPAGITPSDAGLDYARWGSWGNGNGMRAEANRILSVHLPGRREFLFQRDPRLNGESIPGPQPAEASVQFGQIEFNPASGNQAEEFLELTNANPLALDLSGWRLDGAVRHVFRPGTVVPAGRSLYVTPSAKAFRARSLPPRGGQGLFVQGDYSGQLSAWGETVTLVDRAGRLRAARTYAGDPSAAQRALRITEIAYHPDAVPGLAFDPQSYEYLELKNTGPVPIELAGVRLTRGVQFEFTGQGVTSLAPGASVVVVRDPVAFAARYGSGMRVAGPYTGALDNAGEVLRLEDATGEKILEFAYDPAWYPVTDGLGFSLVVVDETAAWEEWSHVAHWRPSARPGGSPGFVDPAPPAPMRVVVNELLAHTDPPQSDAVELWNQDPREVDISGWFLTDDLRVPRKYRLPSGTRIPGGGYRVLTEASFNPQPGVPPSFTFSSVGEAVYLFVADAQTNLMGPYHGFDFGASPNGVAFGRHVDSRGAEHFVLASANTLGAANAPPRVGPIVISEIMYHPPDLGQGENALDEYLELQNIAATNVPLHLPANPEITWSLRGAVTFGFPPGVVVPPEGRLLVAGFDPGDTTRLSAFRERYGLSAATPVLGPWTGRLDNAGETLELLRPDTPNPDVTPQILVERVAYDDEAPWPFGADGLGSSLQRQTLIAFGNDPAVWFASPPTPGAVNTPNLPPEVVLTSPVSGTLLERPIDILLVAEAVDPDGAITRVEFLDHAAKLGEVRSAPYRFTWADAPAGRHVLRARAFDDRLGFAESAEVTIEVRSQAPEVDLTQPGADALVGVGLETALLAEATDHDGVVVAVEFLVDGQSLGRATQAPFGLVWTPPRSGPFVLEAVATDDAGTTRRSPGQPVIAVVAFQESRVLIPAGASWQYRDDGVDPGPGWTGLAYDARLWKVGRAELGYGDGDEATVVGYGPSSASKHITTWFRHPFSVQSLATVNAANLSLVRDDGVVVTLDGTEVFRDNLPEGPILPSTLASAAISGADESAWWVASLPGALLSPGDHVLAVEVHQAAATSSDLSFDARLEVVETTFGPAIRVQPEHQLVAAGATARFRVMADGTPPLAYQWQRNGEVIHGAAQSTLAVGPVAPGQTGVYQVRVMNAAGSVTSQEAWLTVRDPDELTIFRVALTDEGTSLELQFQAVAGRAYAVQTASGLVGAEWTEAERVPVADTARTVTLRFRLDSGDVRFFRLASP